MAHRDIKPENLLLDRAGNLKITDFGLATVFSQQGQRRRLETPCGTAMYMAPEVVSGEGYEGDQADLWSAAVVLFVMSAGCHPWEEPTMHCGHYDCFIKSRCHSYAPWSRFSKDLKELLLGMLKPKADERLSMDQIREHPWVAKPSRLLGADGCCADPRLLAELLAESHLKPVRVDRALALEEEPIPALTQLEITAIFSQAANCKPLNCFSQPAPLMTPSDRSTGTGPGEAQDQQQHLQRLARFYTRAAFDQVMERICQHLDMMLVQYKVPQDSNRVQFSTVDRRKGPLTGDISFHPITDSLNLVIFNKAKGDSLEFKRFYRFLLNELRDLVLTH